MSKPKFKWELRKGHYPHVLDELPDDHSESPRYTHLKDQYYYSNKDGLPVASHFFKHEIEQGTHHGTPIHHAGEMRAGEMSEQVQMCWLGELNRNEVVKSTSRLKQIIRLAYECPWGRPEHGNGGGGWYEYAYKWMDKEFTAASFEYQDKKIEIRRMRTLASPNRVTYCYRTGTDQVEVLINGRRFPEAPEHYYKLSATRTAVALLITESFDHHPPPVMGIRRDSYDICTECAAKTHQYYSGYGAIREGAKMHCVYCESPLFETGAHTAEANSMLLFLMHTQEWATTLTDIAWNRMRSAYRNECQDHLHLYQDQVAEVRDLHDAHVKMVQKDEARWRLRYEPLG